MWLSGRQHTLAQPLTGGVAVLRSAGLGRPGCGTRAKAVAASSRYRRCRYTRVLSCQRQVGGVWQRLAALGAVYLRSVAARRAGKDAKATAQKAAKAVKKGVHKKQRKPRFSVTFHRPKTFKKPREPKYPRQRYAAAVSRRPGAYGVSARRRACSKELQHYAGSASVFTFRTRLAEVSALGSGQHLHLSCNTDHEAARLFACGAMSACADTTSVSRASVARAARPRCRSWTRSRL